MNIGIIAASNIRYSPYIFFYTEILKRIGVDYELIYPNRCALEETFDGTAHVLEWDRSKKTVINYALYAKQVISLVKKRKYDALIVLTTVNAAYLSLWLKKHYKGRYIVDIRDYTHENIPPYFWMEGIAMRNSLMNVISSQQFQTFLPEAKYHVCHNYGSIRPDLSPRCRKKEGKLLIGYVGLLSYENQCRRMMALAAKDDRFAFEFFGTSDIEESLREYARELGADNIRFYGAYGAGEKEQIVQKTDILFNAYGNDHPLVKCLLSNKLYDAMIWKKPLLTSPEAYMTERGGYLAYAIDLDGAQDLDDLYDWYQALDERKVDTFADTAMEAIIEENEQTIRCVMERLQSLERSGEKA